MNREGLVDIKKAAKLLGHSPHTIRHWAKEGRLDHIRLGRKIVFDVSDLDHFVKECRIEARAAK